MTNFILPKLWAVARTRDNAEIVNKWSNEIHKCGAVLRDQAFIYSGRGHCGGNLKEGYTEISFEQFQQYVLNVQPESENYQIY